MEKVIKYFWGGNEILINNIELSATLLRILFSNVLERNVPETSSVSLKNIPLFAYSFSQHSLLLKLTGWGSKSGEMLRTSHIIH